MRNLWSRRKSYFYILHICTKLAFINAEENADEFFEGEVVAATPRPIHQLFYIIIFEFCSILIY